LLMVDGFVVRWFPTSTIRFSAETSTAFNLPPQLPRTPDSTLAQDFRIARCHHHCRVDVVRPREHCL
jgi:hypothetical protein